MLEPSSDRKASTNNLFLLWSASIGDTIAATPSINYFCEQYGNCKVDVWTKHPEIFVLNPNIAKIHSEFDPDIDFLKQWPPSSIKTTFLRGNQKEAVAQNHSHLVDYCSINSMSMILPNNKKTLIVPISDTQRERVKRFVNHPEFLTMQTGPSVVLHASDTWKTRRMPSATWEALASLLVAAGVKVFLIGKDVEHRMPLKLTTMPGVVSLINKLDLLESIALIEQSDAIVTLDSGSLHMAGCTPETRIIAILTVNSPDYRMPHRNGTQDYKTTVANELPSCIYCAAQLQRIDGNLGNCVNSKNAMCCLPTAEKLFELTYKEATAEALERANGSK